MLLTSLVVHSLLAATVPPLGLPPSAGDPPAAIDFAAVPRTFESEPAYVGEPRYGMFLFGEAADARVWAVLDKSNADSDVYDVLYLDRDADGVLGEEGERFDGKVKGPGTDTVSAKFTIGAFAQPTRGKAAPVAVSPKEPVEHSDFTITWTKASVRYAMEWKGKTRTMGGFGPTREVYAGFGASPEAATILVPGYDRPLEFERWLSATLDIGGASDFKVFLGAKGSKRGAFSCGDQNLLPEGEFVIATLIYTNEDDEEKRAEVKLRERC